MCRGVWEFWHPLLLFWLFLNCGKPEQRLHGGRGGGLLFAAPDLFGKAAAFRNGGCFFLSIFFVAVSATVRMTAWEMLIQFFLPFNVTCCICFSVLCSRSCGTEYIAVVLSLLWIALWILIVLDEKIYSVISRPVWGLVLVGTVCYMAAAVERIRRSCGNYQEGKALWN